jgi:hypothetical protein
LKNGWLPDRRERINGEATHWATSVCMVAGQGYLDLAEGAVALSAGSLAAYRGDEELRVRGAGATELRPLAFLAPKLEAPS